MTLAPEQHLVAGREFEPGVDDAVALAGVAHQGNLVGRYIELRGNGRPGGLKEVGKPCPIVEGAVAVDIRGPHGDLLCHATEGHRLAAFMGTAFSPKENWPRASCQWSASDRAVASAGRAVVPAVAAAPTSAAEWRKNSRGVWNGAMR